MKSNFILNLFLFLFLFFIMVFVYKNKNKENMDNIITTDKSESFCKSHEGNSGILNTSCKKLTKNNCNITSCCIWTSDEKCVAGSSNGPTFNTEPNGKTKTLDYYYYKNNCYGNSC
jgi:hypothetical protein